MASINKVILVGHVGRDPELKQDSMDRPILKFSVATTDKWVDKEGDPKSKTEWHNVVCFNDQISSFGSKYLKKGQQVYVEGSISTRKWTDNDDNVRYTTEIVLQRGSWGGAKLLLLGRKEQEKLDGRLSDQLDDEIPF